MSHIDVVERCSELSFHFRQELQLCYQPVISLQNKELYGFEALVFWQPNRAQLYTENIAELVSHSQLDHLFYQWIFYEACRQMKQWQTHCIIDKPLYVSVSLSKCQLSWPYLITSIQQILARTGLAPHHLKVKIPSSSIIQNWSAAQSIIRQLDQHQISICIDDFAPSFSWLQWLQRLSVDTVKLKTPCIHQLSTNRQIRKSYDLTLDIAQNANTKVIAKGIDTDKQLAAVNSLGCTYGQGHLVSQPVSPREVTSLISFQDKHLVLYLTAMHHLSQFAQELLGKMLVTKYWQETKPTKPWLTSIEPYKNQTMPLLYKQLNTWQQKDLQHWTHEFIQRCNQIIRGFSQLLPEANFSHIQKKLLRV
ncbi:EAL domain-containing protein [Leptolyngbya sp. Heron Island J]|uniref:EAL domain-containing protein n=1 Tax=Leptolyngbya sp. Heron Island J TaxID=1385935 RepID=UPI001378755A|nr:EAL domain-containing protein [Leptolyngbya sp. Heron Island J]